MTSQDVAVVTYKLTEWIGTPIKGTFYERDVQNLTVPHGALFRIEKFLKRQGPNVLVRWKGWPERYDCWIPKKEIRRMWTMNE